MTHPLNQRLGIFGGGQLGLMMLQAARNLNLDCGILDPDPNCPCHRATHQFTQGSLIDVEDILQFGRQYHRLTTEFEHINCDALSVLESEGIPFAPSSKCLRLIQDKGLQKQFYARHGFPTAAFHLTDSRKDILDLPIQFPAIQKLRRLGYDGKGVYKLKDTQSIQEAFDGPSVIEEWVDIEIELSVIVCRSQNGDIQTFQPVELIADPEAHLLKLLISPARIDPRISALAIDIAKELATKMEIIGVIAVEFMVSKSGQLLINEVAPRPHNSGHHTIESCAHSQFEQHIRAAMNLPLGVNTSEASAVMINLLGKKGHNGAPFYQNLDRWLSSPNVFIHIYGKAQTKSFRKMGHVTILSSSVTDSIAIAEDIQSSLEVHAT